MANCFGHLGYNLLLTAGRVQPLLRIAVLALATAAVVLPPMVARWGGIGAAYACIGINVAQAFVTLGLAHGKILPGLGFSVLRRDVMIPAMVIGLVMVAAWRLQPGIAEGRGTALVFLLATAAISSVLSAFFAPAIRWEFGMRYIGGPRR
jgi:O-antigen/teichoic acid export membrane protein